jgi:hypothetical protein
LHLANRLIPKGSRSASGTAQKQMILGVELDRRGVGYPSSGSPSKETETSAPGRHRCGGRFAVKRHRSLTCQLLDHVAHESPKRLVLNKLLVDLRIVFYLDRVLVAFDIFMNVVTVGAEDDH